MTRDRNHYVELTDDKGNAIRLTASGVLLGKCAECIEIVVALSNIGMMRCTHCGGAVKWQWAKPQLAFLPEEESKFLGWDRGKKS